MKKLRKITSLVLALMLVLGIAVAFAGETSGEDEESGSGSEETTAITSETIGSDGTITLTTVNDDLLIPMVITVKGSSDLAKVYGPTVEYSYTIAAASTTDVPTGTETGAPYTVKDSSNNTGNIKIGPNDGVSLTDNKATFTSSSVNLTNGEGTVSDTITVHVDLTKFNTTTYGPGIYRYKITDTTTVLTLYNAGITRADNYDKEYFLDVYLKRTETTDSETGSTTYGVAVYGYVLSDSSNATITTSTANKKAQFPGDTYQTVDVEVEKQVTGDMGDKNHEFPFTISVTNKGGTSANLYYFGGENTCNVTADTTAANSESISVSLKHGEKYLIRGLNPKATVAYEEQNNTFDAYVLSVKDNAATPAAVKDDASSPADITNVSLSYNGKKKTAILPVTDYDTENKTTSGSEKLSYAVVTNSNGKITFTNNLDSISPTGYVARFAPYALILVAGIALLVVAMKKRKTSDEE